MMDSSENITMEKDCLLKEYPLKSNFLQKIPAKAQKGLSTFTIEFTCIDADGHYLAVGTNIGIVYLLDRRNNNLTKIRNDDRDYITQVKILISLECMVVFGCKSGAVLLFKISLDLNEQSEKFRVDGLHTCAISALEWVRNGIQFYSGDENGRIIVTEIDHLEHQSRSRVLLEEGSQIVQLSYSHKYLVVSTLFRSVIYSCLDSSTVKMGRKERKCFGPFGALHLSDAIFASRPGQRLWVSDTSGTIRETLLFKTALQEHHPRIPLLDGRTEQVDFSDFGRLLSFNHRYIAVCCDSAIVLVDPQAKCVVASCARLDPIIDVATSGDEIFVLRGLRHLVRISTTADPYESEMIPDEPSLMEELLVPFKELSSFVKERTDSLSSRSESIKLNVFDWLKKKRSDSSPAHLQDPVPEVVKLDVGDLLPVVLTETSDQHLSKVEPVLNSEDDIVFKPKKKNKRKVRFRSASPRNRDSIKSSTETVNKVPDELSPPSHVTEPFLKETENVLPIQNPSLDAKEVEGNDTVHPDNNMNVIPSDDKETKACNEQDTISEIDTGKSLTNLNQKESSKESSGFMEPDNIQEVENQVIRVDSHNPVTDVDDIYSSFPPSPDTNPRSQHEVECKAPDIPDVSPPAKYGVDWVEYKAPDLLLDLCVSNHSVFCVDVRHQAYMSGYPVLGLQWKVLEQPAQRLSVSPSEGVVWALYRGTVFAAVRKTSSNLKDAEWISIARDVVSMSVEENYGWYVTTNGLLTFQNNLSQSRPFGYPQSVPTSATVTQVTVANGVVWALTSGGRIISSTRQAGDLNRNWKHIELSESVDVDSIYLGVHGTGWIVDMSGEIRFLMGVSPDHPEGQGKAWEVETSKYFLKTPTQMQKALQKADVLSSLIKGKQHISMSTSAFGVWFCKTLEPLVYANQKALIGHMWDCFIPLGTASSTKWALMSAGGLSGASGSIWCMDKTGELFCFCPKTKMLVAVDCPSSIASLVPSHMSLWVLDPEGRVFVRRGITPSCPEGNRWKEMDLTQLGGERIVHVDCASDVAWACTREGSVLMRLGPLCRESALQQAWISITTEVIITEKSSFIRKKSPVPLVQSYIQTVFSKIYVGPLGFPVWSLDAQGSVYVREGVCPSMPVGTEWTSVPELRAKALCISRNAVWLLKYSGKIYRRFGVSENNPCGDYWKQMPGCVDHLSVTATDDLWALKENSIYSHSSFVLQFAQNKGLRRDVSEDDWEDIMDGY